jgi:outer membrane protein assembly factor BamB
VEPLAEGDPRQVGMYRLRARLGSGGMGQVFLGSSPAGRAVAVKVIHRELVSDPMFRTRFRREVAAARAVSGAYTAPVTAAGPDDDPPWLATVFVPGPSLADAVDAAGPWPAASVWKLAAGLVEALQAVHASGLVHRDLKPANVLLAPDGPRVIDFGISRAVEGTRMTSTGLIVGTPSFMSPEQAQGDSVGPPSDVFSLGCVIVFAATGAGAFGDGPLASTLYRVVHTEPALGRVPPGLRELAAACLAKAPGDRPAMAALVDAISTGLGPEPETGATSFWPPAVASLISSHQARVSAEITGLSRTAAAGPGPATEAAAPVAAGAVPVVTDALPVVTDALPVVTDALPVVTDALPVTGALPVTAAGPSDVVPAEPTAEALAPATTAAAGPSNAVSFSASPANALRPNAAPSTVAPPSGVPASGDPASGVPASGALVPPGRAGLTSGPAAAPGGGAAGPGGGTARMTGAGGDGDTERHPAPAWPADLPPGSPAGRGLTRRRALIAAAGLATAVAAGAVVETALSGAGHPPARGRKPAARKTNAGPPVAGRPGTQLWSFTAGAPVTSGITVTGGVVHLGSVDNNVYALNAGDGTKVWSYATGGPIQGSGVAVAGGAVYIGSNDKNIYALHAGTGRKIWKFATPYPVDSGFAVAAKTVYGGTIGVTCYALSASHGRELWDNTTGGTLQGIATDGQNVYAGCVNAAVVALRADGGKVLWTFPASGPVLSGITVAGGVVYAGGDDTVYALSAADGGRRWSFTAGGTIHSGIAVAGGVVYVGSWDNKVYALRASDGRKLWEFTTGSFVSSGIAVAGGIVYAGSTDSHVYALRASDGRKLWSFATRGSVESGIAVANGVVYAGSTDNNIYALRA